MDLINAVKIYNEIKEKQWGLLPWNKPYFVLCNKQWKVVKLNLFLRILRHFGLFQETHQTSIRREFIRQFCAIEPSHSKEYKSLKKVTALFPKTVFQREKDYYFSHQAPVKDLKRFLQDLHHSNPSSYVNYLEQNFQNHASIKQLFPTITSMKQMQTIEEKKPELFKQIPSLSLDNYVCNCFGDVTFEGYRQLLARAVHVMVLSDHYLKKFELFSLVLFTAYNENRLDKNLAYFLCCKNASDLKKSSFLYDDFFGNNEKYERYQVILGEKSDVSSSFVLKRSVSNLSVKKPYSTFSDIDKKLKNAIQQQGTNEIPYVSNFNLLMLYNHIDQFFREKKTFDFHGYEEFEFLHKLCAIEIFKRYKNPSDIPAVFYRNPTILHYIISHTEIDWFHPDLVNLCCSMVNKDSWTKYVKKYINRLDTFFILAEHSRCHRKLTLKLLELSDEMTPKFSNQLTQPSAMAMSRVMLLVKNKITIDDFCWDRVKWSLDDSLWIQESVSLIEPQRLLSLLSKVSDEKTLFDLCRKMVEELFSSKRREKKSLYNRINEGLIFNSDASDYIKLFEMIDTKKLSLEQKNISKYMLNFLTVYFNKAKVFYPKDNRSMLAPFKDAGLKEMDDDSIREFVDLRLIIPYVV